MKRIKTKNLPRLIDRGKRNLLEMIAKIRDHEGTDWTEELAEALDRAFAEAEMYDSMEVISFANIAKARPQPDETHMSEVAVCGVSQERANFFKESNSVN